MAIYTKRGSTWKVQVRWFGVSKSNTFSTKAACQAWANEIESLIISGKYQRVPDVPVSVLLKLYASEVSSSKDGCKWEINQLNLIGRDPVAEVHLPVLDLCMALPKPCRKDFSGESVLYLRPPKCPLNWLLVGLSKRSLGQPILVPIGALTLRTPDRQKRRE